jgi:hypothetical protein
MSLRQKKRKMREKKLFLNGDRDGGLVVED